MFDDRDDYDYFVPEDDYRQQFPEDYTDEMSAFLGQDDMGGEDGDVEIDDFDDADDYDADYYDNLFDQV
jgi:hypothetical protein